MKHHVNEAGMSAPEEIKSFPADAARGNYLCMNRPDAQFSAKENIAGHVISNEEGSAQHRKNGEKAQRVQQEFKFEALDTTLTMRTDSDWAGCQHRCRQVLEFHTGAGGAVVV